jgi:hypothetical protein
MIIDNSCLDLANAQDWLSRSKGMTVDIWITDYDPPRCKCFQKKISGRGKHNVNSLVPKRYTGPGAPIEIWVSLPNGWSDFDEI